MKLGLDASDTNSSPPHIVTFMKFVFPLMTLLVTINFPSSLCFYWLVSNIISGAQGAILKIPSVQKLLGIQSYKQWSDKDLPMNSINIFQQAANMKTPQKMHYSNIEAQKIDGMYEKLIRYITIKRNIPKCHKTAKKFK